jgi:putative endonuclease
VSVRPERQEAQRRGRWAEALAAWRLRLSGYRIVARNYRTPMGEIDLIARRGRTLAFVEVKQRGRQSDAAEAIRRRQRQRIERAASAFLASHPDFAQFDLQFDVVLLSSGLLPRHLRDAWRSDTGQSR